MNKFVVSYNFIGFTFTQTYLIQVRFNTYLLGTYILLLMN